MTTVFRTPARWTDSNVTSITPPIGLVSERLGTPVLDAVAHSPDLHRFCIRWLRRAGDAPWGQGSYVLYTFEGHKRRKRPLGLVKQVAYSEALKKAKGYSAALADPSRNLAAEIAAAEQAHGDVFPSYLERFFAWHVSEGHTERHIKDTKTYLSAQFLPSLQSLPLRHIRRQHIADALDRLLGTRGQYSKVRSNLCAYFTFLVKRGVIDTNVVRDTQALKKGKRERCLNENELRALLSALDLGRRFDRLIALVVLTGARRDQIGGLRHDRIRDLDGPFPHLELPPAGTSVRGGSKSKERFIIPLSRQAISILRRQLAEGLGNQFVFGRTAAFAHWTRSLDDLRQRMGVLDWSLHDLRRTFCTLAARHLDADFATIDAAINHKPQHRQGTAGVYQLETMLPARTKLFQGWGDFCEALAPPRPGLSLVAA